MFDAFGTVMDWRTSSTREVHDLATRKGLRVDVAKFTDAWRAGYMPSMNRVRTGELPISCLMAPRTSRLRASKISPASSASGAD